ncbi:hypothetical protein [Campylobacter sp. RM12647]|uniref:hypothetical protein n=1 Tax=Campylobacter sp. RM12647 TaxID=2735737 RepID=UPI001D28FA23|nr:hypothetical protein [Campylobacter sp. RM12647]
MFKKTLKVLSLVAVLGLSANANDLLADISKGAISDSSLGVKVLNTEEMNKVRGGYIPVELWIDSNTYGVFAITDLQGELGARFNSDGLLIRNSIGLCPMGQSQCYLNPETKMHNELNTQRLFEYWAALGNYFKVTQYWVGFAVHKDQNGIFEYRVYALNIKDVMQHKTLTLHNISNSYNRNNNLIINELKREFKRSLELSL